MIDVQKIIEIECLEPTKEELLRCKECGGGCCKSMGCSYIPSDFDDLSYDVLKSKIDEGFIAIDWYIDLEVDGEVISRGYYLRVRNVDTENVVDPSWGGVCSKWTEEGCSFSYKDRPFGGKALKSSSDVCKAFLNKYDISLLWYPHYSVLDKLYNHYRGLDTDSIDGSFDTSIKKTNFGLPYF